MRMRPFVFALHAKYNGYTAVLNKNNNNKAATMAKYNDDSNDVDGATMASSKNHCVIWSLS